MEPKFQTSFIPKKPIISEPGSRVAVSHSINIFSAIATIVFVLTILTSGGVFIYKNILESQILLSDKSFNAAREAFHPEKMQELIDANSRIMAVKGLLEKHIASSEHLVLLQSLTVKRMRFNSLSYVNKNLGLPTLSIDGEVATYNALAEQEEIFSKNEFIKNPQFSNFRLEENGVISVKFFTTIDPKLVSYKQYIESLSPEQ